MPEIVETVGILIKWVQNEYFNNLFGYEKAFRPMGVTMAQLTTSKEYLAMLRLNRNDFWYRFITVEETLIHHSTLETKEKSR